MIISEKQILQLLRLAEGFSHALHKFGEHKQADIIQNLLLEINGQQSEELREVKE